jgi:hypothetical protein
MPHDRRPEERARSMAKQRGTRGSATFACATLVCSCNSLVGIDPPIEPTPDAAHPDAPGGADSDVVDAAPPMADASDAFGATDALASDTLANDALRARDAVEASANPIDASADVNRAADANADAGPILEAAPERTSPVCRPSQGSETDPNTGVTWTTLWYCGNDYLAPVFEKASSATQVASMSTTDSWFVCFRHGDPHKGGNDVWYYTQGDHIVPGWEGRKAWGYMPAYSVFTSVDPVVGMVECAADPAD